MSLRRYPLFPDSRREGVTPASQPLPGWRLFLILFFLLVFMAYTACQMPLR
jgi:hypothetical protein